MIGSIRWNFVLGTIGFALTFIISLTKNVLLTTLIRSLICFVVLFSFAFLLRWFLGTVAGLKNLQAEPGEGVRMKAPADRLVGQKVNLTTQAEEETLQNILKKNIQNPVDAPDFSPLNPPKLYSIDAAKTNPENIAKAIRYLSDVKDGEV